MKQKARLKAIQKAAHNKAGEGQPIAEVIIYGTNDNGETHHLATIQTGTRVFLPDNHRDDVQKAGQP
jgi:hypothetical protein